MTNRKDGWLSEWPWLLAVILLGLIAGLFFGDPAPPVSRTEAVDAKEPQ